MGLVIDASVLRAAGESNVDSSRHCRHFLEEVLGICHHALASRELTGEWRKHRSRFSSRWLLSMFSRKKVRIEPASGSLRSSIETLDLTARQSRHLFKDLHLVEIALQGDRRIISLDETSRGLFTQAAASIPDLRRIVWVNPTQEEDSALEWVGRFCPLEEHRTLGESSQS